MTVKLHNTLTKKVEVFRPLKKEIVSIFSCGPTVYDFAHIGNFRAFMGADILKRWLKYKGYKVRHVMNITDVDDKIINKAKDLGKDPLALAKEYEKAFYEDMKTLNMEKPDYASASEHIPEIINQIERMISKGLAYITKTSIYFDTTKFKDYGKLSRQNIEELKQHRIEQDQTKKNDPDFALWKFHKPGELSWESPWGKGRPGWHIEDTAISEKYLGQQYDIHTGGSDLIFPHHEAEICQMESLSGKNLVNYWVHQEHLLVEGKKMSKSLGNFYTLRDLLAKGYKPRAIRYLLVSSQYGQQMNFTFPSLEAANEAVEKFDNFLFSLKNAKGSDSREVSVLIKKTEESFENSMDNDLDMSPALASVFEFMKEINKLMSENKISKNNADDCIRLIKKIDSVLGILKEDKEEVLSPEIRELVEQREFFRKKKDWKKSDELRDKLLKLGIQIWDTPEGPKWKGV